MRTETVLVRFEHINLACKSLDATQAFYQKVFPHWRVRASGVHNGNRWVHFGDDQFYLALNDMPEQDRCHEKYAKIGVNHVGFVIRDGAAMMKHLEENEIPYYTLPAPETKHRIYVSDPDGNESELLEYQPDYALR